MQEYLHRLEDALAELRRLRDQYTLEDLKRDRLLEWALRYGLLESIQIIIDISCHLVSRNNLGTPSSYSECIALLARGGYLSEELARKLQLMVGLRNLLVHEYTSIDIEQLYQYLDQLPDFVQFIESVQPYL